nr:response regulator [Cohnella sp. WQ 127256]
MADDERIIREGIAALIPWKELRLKFDGSAINGLVAHHHIIKAEYPPDIVITDIKMPEMNGLELIKLTKERYPDMKFIVLSGYGEFEFASQAMQYGVQHYLLKPCNEAEINDVLRKVVEELDQKRNETSYMKEIEDRLAETLPIRMEKFLLECLLNQSQSKEKMDLYKRVLQIGNLPIHTIVVQMQEGHVESQSDRLEVMFREFAEGCRLLLGTAIEDKFVLLVQDEPWVDLERLSDWIKRQINSGVNEPLNLVILEACRLEEIGEMYQSAIKKLKYQDYFGSSSMITGLAVDDDLSDATERLSTVVDAIVSAVRWGEPEEIDAGIAAFFDKLRSLRGEIHTTIGFCIELMTTLVRKAAQPSEVKNTQITPILGMKTLEEIQRYILHFALESGKESERLNADKNRLLVLRMKVLIEEQLANKELSLQGMARENFFMSVDYLGKLFRRETNEKFSRYLTRLRVERAMDIITADPECKIYEVAELTGFGDDSQYFSNVFKRHTGMSPMEFKKNRRPPS